MDKILRFSGSFDEMKKEMQESIIKDLNSSCSLNYLNNALNFYKGLITEIENLRIFFDCEIGCNVTKISVKLIDGTVFMQMLADDRFYTVPEDMQSEIIKFLVELCNKSIECIVKRIPIAKKQKQKDIIGLCVMFLFAVFIVAFHIKLTDIIVSCLNIGSTYLNTMRLVIRFGFKIIGLILMIKACIASMRLIWIDDV